MQLGSVWVHAFPAATTRHNILFTACMIGLLGTLNFEYTYMYIVLSSLSAMLLLAYVTLATRVT